MKFIKFKKTLSNIALAAFGTLLATIGLLTAYFNVLNTYDQVGVFSINAVANGGLALALVGLICVYVSGSKKITASNKIENPTPSPIETALAALVMDYVKDREDERAHKTSDTTL